MLGAKYVLSGALFSALVLSLFLYSVSAGANYPHNSTSAVSNALPMVSTETGSTTAEPVLTAQEQNVATTGDCAISSKFPDSVRQWCDLISHYAAKRDLPPDLVAAVIWQESGGAPAVYSHSGAVGLMQIMPKDGAAASFMCVNGPCFANRPSSAELENPEFNISYGTKMLAGLNARTGDLREALKSYGPMNVGYYYADKVLGLYEKYGSGNQVD